MIEMGLGSFQSRQQSRRVTTTLSLVSLFHCLLATAGAQQPGLPLRYPPTTRGSQADEVGGVRAADPYRWLESTSSADVRTWVSSQNALTESYLGLLPRRKEIAERLGGYAARRVTSPPDAGGERIFFAERNGSDNQPVIFVQDRPETRPRVLLDPNAFSPDGLIAIVDRAASPDGRYLAYGVSIQGSSSRTIHVRDVRTTQDLSDNIRGVKQAPIGWTADSRGFFYVRTLAGAGGSDALAPDGRQQLLYHRVGRGQEDDQMIFEAPDHPDWRLDARVSEDGQYLVIALTPKTEPRTRLYFIDLDNPDRPNLRAPVVKLFDTGDAFYEFVSSDGPLFFVRTNKNAPRGRIVAVDINSPDENHWTNVVRESYDALVGAVRVGNRVVAHHLRNGRSTLDLYAFDGGARGSVPIPGIGTVSDLTPLRDKGELYFTYSSFLQPPEVLHYDLDTRTELVYRDAGTDSTFNTYETTQLFYTSRDGTRIPLFITARRGLTLNGTHPTLLAIGDAAFGRPASLAYSPMLATWISLGGIYAVADVRGGGEDGRLWHEAAMGARKQTTTDDLTSAAAFLIDQRYTRPSLLGLVASGFGGIAAGNAITRRPDLFAAATIDGGVFDLTRFNRFTVGWTWVSEFGAPTDGGSLRSLLAVSPLQNALMSGRFPAVLVSASEHDDVVPPLHSYKFAATLQASQTGPGPELLRVEPDIGVESTMPLSKQSARDADRLTFLLSALRTLP
jgi:prolyl oligopeptidase